jgi:hypothetical protein
LTLNLSFYNLSVRGAAAGIPQAFQTNPQFHHEEKMRIFPRPLEVGPEDGFKNDSFEKEKLGDALTNLVSNVTDPLVIALDAPWGSGKTTFLKMWAGALRKNGFPVVFF